MSKSAVVFSAAGVGLVMAIAVAVVITHDETAPTQVSIPVSTGGHTTGTPSATQAHEAAAALAKLTLDPASLVASGAGPEALAGARAAVPPGSKVDVAESSWAPDGVGGGTVMVTVKSPQGGPVTYAAVMVHEPGGWKVLATLPLERPTSISGSESTP